MQGVLCGMLESAAGDGEMSMEINKAIEILNNKRSHCEGEICEAYSLATNALEKQMPKKPELMNDQHIPGVLALNLWVCLGCGTRYDYGIEYEEHYFCPWCGQAIDWSDGGK